MSTSEIKSEGKTRGSKIDDFPMVQPQNIDGFGENDMDQSNEVQNLKKNQELIDFDGGKQTPYTQSEVNENSPQFQDKQLDIDNTPEKSPFQDENYLNTNNQNQNILNSNENVSPEKLIKEIQDEKQQQIPLRDPFSQKDNNSTDSNNTSQFNPTQHNNNSLKKTSTADVNAISLAKEQVKLEQKQIGYLEDNKMNQDQLQQREIKKLGYLGVDARIYSLKPKNFDRAEIIMQCHNLVKEFKIFGRDDTVKALHNVNLNPQSEFYPIRQGEFVIIRGPSGCGKTTFLNLLGSIDMATGGKIELLGDVIDHKSKDEYLSNLRLEKIGFVFQTFNLLATMTAYENVELPMRVHGKLSDKEMKKRTRNLLTRVGLQDRMDHLPSELSGGEQQRVAIARALGNSPKVLLLDEPTGDLDTRSTVEVMNLLLSINNFGYSQEDQSPATLVMVTHNPDIEMYADRILYFKDGNIVQQVLNEVQVPLQWEDYVNYLNSLN